jgi:hypothetical protein
MQTRSLHHGPRTRCCESKARKSGRRLPPGAQLLYDRSRDTSVTAVMFRIWALSSELFGGPVATLSYHLRLGRAADPELRSAHEKASKSGARVTARGLERMQELITVFQQTGRYPSKNAANTSERALAAWLQRRRVDAWANTLATAFREGLAVLPGWEGKPRGEADEECWRQRLAELKAYRAAGNDWPRHKAVITGEEHDLGVLAAHPALQAALWRPRRREGSCPGQGRAWLADRKEARSTCQHGPDLLSAPVVLVSSASLLVPRMDRVPSEREQEVDRVDRNREE